MPAAQPVSDSMAVETGDPTATKKSGLCHPRQEPDRGEAGGAGHERGAPAMMRREVAIRAIQSRAPNFSMAGLLGTSNRK